jgi:hypothetical protein
MRKIALALAILGTTLCTALFTAPAHAQATRTWVSGVGDDANPCSRTAPCKTWAGAISKTAPGGEIDALDPGGFGAVTITKSMTLDGGGGQVASVLVSGTNGINVAAGATDVVVLKNLRFQGLLGAGNANAGITGISYSSGALVVVDHCEIYGFNTTGINVALSATGVLEVNDSQFFNNKTQLSATATGGTALVQIVRSSFVGTQTAGTATQGGVNAGSGSNVTVSDSNFEDLTFGAQVVSGGGLFVDSSSFATGVGIQANSATANASNNTFALGAACNTTGGGTLKTANNNKVGGTAGSCTVSATMTVE